MGYKITWVEKGGKVHSNVGTRSYSSFQKRMSRDFPGSRIIKVTTTGGGERYKTEAGHWSTKDVVLAEAKPVYTKGKIDWDKFKTENPQLDYLLTHGDIKQRLKLGRAIASKKPDIIRNIETQQTAQQSYQSMTEAEQIQYGIQFHTFTEEPVGEWKYYLGGKEYLKSLPKKEQTRLAEQYISSGSYKTMTGQFAREWLYEGKIFDKSSSLGVSEITGVDASARKHAWEQITSTPEQIRAITYEAMPQSLRIGTSYVGAFTKAVFSPITLPQAIVKFATGKTALLPDVSQKLEKVFPYGSSGLIDVGISEGVGAVTGQHVGKWDQAMKYPFETLFATVGEVAGLIVGGKAVRLGTSSIKKGVVGSTKIISKKIPTYYYKVTQELGLPKSLRHIIYEHHGGYIQRSWQKLHSYSLGEMKFVKSFKQKGLPKIKEIGKGAGIGRKETVKFSGFGKRELVPTNVYNLAKERMLSSGTGTLRGIAGTPKSKWEYIFTTDKMKIKGLLYKRITQTKTSLRITSPQLTDKGFSGFVNIAPIKGVMPKGYSPVGSHYNLEKMLSSSSAIKHSMKSMKPFLPNELASTSFTVPHHTVTIPSMVHTGGKIGHRSLDAMLQIPASKVSSIGMLSASLIGTGYLTSEILKIGKVSRRDTKTKVGLRDLNLSLSASAFDTISLSLSKTEQVQKQKQAQKLKLRMDMDLKTALVHKGRSRGGASPPHVPIDFKIRIPPLPFLDEGKRKKKKDMSMKMDVGFRSREWKVKDISSMLTVNSLGKEMKRMMKEAKL